MQNAVLAMVEGRVTAHRLLEGLMSQAGGQASPFGTFGMLAVMFLVFYFLILRPQSKQAKERKAMLSSLKKGDVVVIGGGIVGKIHQVIDKTMVVEIAAGVRVKVLVSSITSRVSEGLANEESKPDTKSEAKPSEIEDKSDAKNETQGEKQ